MQTQQFSDAYGNVQDYFINQFILKDWRLYLRIYMYTQKKNKPKFVVRADQRVKRC